MSRFQFNLGALDAAQVEAATVSFVQRVFLWMAGGLAITGAIAAYMGLNEALVTSFIQSGLFWGVLIGELVLVLVLSWAIARLSATAATAMFLLYAVANGLTLSVIFLAYTSASIAATFFVTASTFGATAVFGYVTKRDLTAFGSLMYMLLIGLVIATVVNLFWANSALYWVTTYAGIVIFVGLTAYDTQKIKNLAALGLTGEQGRKAAVMGALALYLDFVVLFLYLLRLFGRRR
jgi:FtsH-binding integral membrane protein